MKKNCVMVDIGVKNQTLINLKVNLFILQGGKMADKIHQARNSRKKKNIMEMNV